MTDIRHRLAPAPRDGCQSVEILFALMARTDDHNQLGRADVEAKDVARGTERNDEFTQSRALTNLVKTGPAIREALQMGRKTKGDADAVMDAVARLPWWGGVAAAAVAYLGLSRIAAWPAGNPAALGPDIGVVLVAMVQALAVPGQYVLPLLCLAGAGLSAFRRRQRMRLVTSAAQVSGARVIDGMRWQEFELLLGEAFRRQGYHVLETGGGGADGGVDLVLSRPSDSGDEKTLVQCKQWRAYKVGVDVVRELYGVMAARGAAAGIVVTSGKFTAEANAFAQGRNVRLIDGPAVEAMIRPAKAQPSLRPPTVDAPPATRVADQALSLPATAGTPACPACGKPMVQRTARRGGQAGSRFWGCSAYPACRGTRAAAPH